jgi:sulfonate transport system ATP-binding protein
MTESRSSAEVEIKSISRTFDSGQGPVHALEDIDLTIGDGEFISIIGPSGCGKSTLLRIIAGLDQGYTGEVRVGGVSVEKPGIDRGFIFQESRLLPWMNVERNIAANLKLRDSSVRDRVHELIDLVQLKGFEKAYPQELSGGMAQRVSLARALLREPSVLLLDEPFGALDAFTRSDMQQALHDIWQQQGTSTILVTHDVDEAIALANRVVILEPRPGRIKSVVPIDLPYPRIKTSRDLLEYRYHVLTEFESDSSLESAREGVGSAGRP